MNEQPPFRVAVDLLQTAPPSWLEVLSGLLTPLIAVVTVYIAYQQYKLSKVQFRHESYERRLQVYKTVQRFLSEVGREGKTNFPRLSQFYSEASEAVFLFDPSVQKYIEEIYSKGVELVTLHEQMYPYDGSPGLPVGEERSRVAKEHGETLKWQMKQLAVSKEFFGNKMGIGQ